jgi:hypothetical protein
MSVGEASERKNAFAEGKEKKKRYFRNVAATGRSCNVGPESSSVPDVETRTQEISPLGGASEQKIASADAKGKKKRYFRNVAATGRSCNVEPESSAVPDAGTRTQEIITVGEVSEPKNTAAEAKGKWKRFPKKRYYKKIAATVRSSNVIPKSSSFPDVATRTQETLPVGEASEQKNTVAETNGNWKRFPRKRYFKRIAATVRSCNVRPMFPSFEAICSGDAATGNVEPRDADVTPGVSPEAGVITSDPEIEESKKLSESGKRSTQKKHKNQSCKRRGKQEFMGLFLLDTVGEK